MDLPALPVTDRVLRAGAERGARFEKLAKILRPVALPVGEIEAPGLAWILRVPRAPCRLLALLAARHGVRDGDLIGGRHGAAASIVDLIDALVVVGLVDDVVGVTGGVDGGGGFDNGDSLGGGGSSGRVSGRGSEEGESSSRRGAGGCGGRGGRFGRGGGRLREV